jgi:hypothetical protein
LINRRKLYLTTSSSGNNITLVARIKRFSKPVKNDSLRKIRFAIFYLTPGKIGIEFRMRVGATLVIERES